MPQIEIRLWLAHMYEVDAPTLETYQSWLRPDERRRYSGFMHERRRREFIVGHGLARRALALELRCEPSDVTFNVVDQGKLAIEYPASNHPIHFNITHTADYVGCVTCSACAVGVDVERLDERVSVGDIASRFFSEVESNHLRTLGEAAQLEEFFTIWTLKEALAKAHGLGLAAPLESSQICANDAGVAATTSYPPFCSGAWLACCSPTRRHRLALCALCAESSDVSILPQAVANSGDVSASGFEWITGRLRVV